MANNNNNGTNSFEHFATDAIHAGQEPDKVTGAVMIPISLATTFVQSSPGLHTGYEYARTGNPTRNAYEACVAKLENGKYAVAFASGLAATSNILHLLNSGDEIVGSDDMYGGTNRYFHKIAQPFANLKFKLADLTNLEEVENAITENTKILWIETPTNPTLKIIDIKAVSEIAHNKNKDILVVVDNTFLSPYFQRPLDLGADIVLHSVSKYINGHSDVIGGIVITNLEDVNTKLKFLQNGMGAIASAFDSFLVLRGLKTLHIRMERHGQNAIKVAEFLENHDKIEKVFYPGLESHPQHELAKKQQTGFGGMVTFFLKGGLPQARTFLESLKLIHLAESLGGVESLIEHPAIMTHASVPTEQRQALGINDSLVRLSVGIEDVDDLINDLGSALDAVVL